MKPSTWPTSLLTIIGAIDLLRRNLIAAPEARINTGPAGGRNASAAPEAPLSSAGSSDRRRASAAIGSPAKNNRASGAAVTLPFLIMISWGVITLALFIISTLGQSSELLPVVVSAFHFYFLLRALVCLAFGAGFMVMSGALARWWSRQAAASEVTATGVAMIVTLLLSAALYPDYLDREAFTTARRRAIEWQSSDDRRAREWIRGNTSASTVFVAWDDDALRIVGAAGRKVICMDPYFSNPYVDRAPRAAARDALFAALAAGDRDKFLELAKSNHATHILIRHDRLTTLKPRDVPFIKVYYKNPQVSIAYITP
jgi:hypothetical protein